MDQFYKITIPEPCHEDWNTMSPKAKGRFCDSCSKTVIDFTKMDIETIQEFIHTNKHKKLCGHFKQEQLDSINLRIPFQVIQNQQNIYKTFLFALLIVMGSNLFSCTNNDGKPQKIDSVEVINSTNNQVIDVLGGLSNYTVCDTLETNNSSKKIIPPPLIPVITGDIIMGVITPEKKPNDPFSYYDVEVTPEFKNTPQHLSIIEKRDYFQKEMNQFIVNNFNGIEISSDLGLIDKQRIYSKFTIDSLGNIRDIMIRSPHIRLEKETEKVLKKLPQFVPAKNDGKNVSVSYTLPITFKVEE